MTREDAIYAVCLGVVAIMVLASVLVLFMR
jgi:hypothetical protein